MAGIVALELGNSDVNLTFKGGREDCADSPGDSADHTYPEPIMDRHEMYDWFLNSVDGFGMDENKVIVFFSMCSLLEGTQNIQKRSNLIFLKFEILPF